MNGIRRIGGPFTFTYGYDDLYRLTSASGNFEYQPGKVDQFSLTLSYDGIHNIKSKTQVHEIVQPGTTNPAIPQRKTSYAWIYDYTGAQPHAPSHIGQRAFLYDLNGNQSGWDHDQNGTNRRIAWDEENRIQTITDTGHTTTYKYDDAGERVIKRGPQGETVYVYQFFTIRNREVGTKHVFVGASRTVSKLMAQDKPGGNPSGVQPREKDLYFYHPDHLGSTAYVTDTEGKLYQHLQYFPFGETWVEQATNTQRTPYRFTGKELDEETGLYYFGARYYDPRTSVWQSPDPILGQYLDGKPNGGVFGPVNLALFSYVSNNPVIATDPTGQFGISEAAVELLLERTAIAGVTSQADSPVPGPADVVAVVILIASLGAFGYSVLTEETEDDRPQTVFRGLSQTDKQNLESRGAILPANPEGTISAEQHVGGMPSVRGDSPFVSATRSLEKATEYTMGGMDPGNLVAEIDPSKVPGPMIDVSVPGALQDPVAQDIATRDEEVLFVGPVPASAIVGYHQVPPAETVK